MTYATSWISLTVALQQVSAIEGEDKAWESLKYAIANGAVRACGLLDGKRDELRGEWLCYLLYDAPEADIVWFDAEKAWRQFNSRKGAELTRLPPNHAEQIEVDGRQVDCLWPAPTVQDSVAGSAEQADSAYMKRITSVPRRRSGRKKAQWHSDLKRILTNILEQAPGALRQVGSMTWPQQYDWIAKRWKTEGLASSLPQKGSGSFKDHARKLIVEAVERLPD